MLSAVRFMYAGAGIALTYGVAFVSTPHVRTARIPIGDPTSSGYKAGYIAGGVIIGLTIGGLWLWMAWANKQGRSWARVLSTTFFGIMTLYALSGLVALSVVPKVLIVLNWAVGLAAIVCLWQGQSNDYYELVSQQADYPPMS